MDNEQLLHVVERIENLNEQIKELNADKKQVLENAKGQGFEKKAILHVVKQRAKEKSKRIEEEQIFKTYELAVGLD